MGRFRKIELSSFTDDVYGFPANSSARYLQRQLKERESPMTTGFQKEGSYILGQIYEIERKNGELKKICQEGSLYGTSSQHIQECIVGIKDQMTEVQLHLNHLSQNLKYQGFSNQQIRAVAEKGLLQLQSRFLRSTGVFKLVLENRQARLKNMELKKGTGGFNGKNFQIKKKFASFMKPKKRIELPSNNPQEGEEGAAIMMEEIEEDEDHDHESLQNIERTLLELNSIFQRMSTIVEEHQTMIQRIDINTEAALDYAEKGKKELTEAYKTLADCRKLMLKIFFILFVFSILYILFLV